MTDPVAAVTDAIIKQLNGSIGPATILLLLSAVVSAVTVFLRSDQAKTLPGLKRFMVPIDTLTHASTRANVLFWISRELLMLRVALPTAASIATAYGYASHAVSAAMLGAAGHTSDRQPLQFLYCS